jgi:hypothetical protein
MIKESFSQIVQAFSMPLSTGFSDLPNTLEGMMPAMKKKAHEMGDVVGTAIRSAITGDTELILGIGELIGYTLKEGVKIGFQGIGGEILGGIAGLADEFTPGGFINKKMGRESFRESVTGGSRDVVKSSAEYAAFEISEMARDLQNTSNEQKQFMAEMRDMFKAGSRPGSPGNTPQMDAMLRQLERIAGAVDKPFSN